VFWIGSSNVITSVTDRMSDGTMVGNTYNLVDYLTSGGISMATYVATNIQGFPDPNPAGNYLIVQASLSVQVPDGGLTLSAWSGVSGTFAQALAAHQHAAGAGSSATVADPGAVAVSAGQLAYGVSMADAVAPLDKPATFTDIGVGSDASLENDVEYLVATAAGSAHPQWTWHFENPQNPPHTWLPTALTLDPAAGPPEPA